MKYILKRIKPNQRRGAVAVLVLVMFPVLLGFTALTIDVGRLYTTRAELQNTADAAALAASLDLGGSDPRASIHRARSRAIQYISENRVWKKGGTSSHEITFGEAALLMNGSGIEYTVGVSCANAVKVTVYYDLKYSFASVLGFTSKRVGASAIAGIASQFNGDDDDSDDSDDDCDDDSDDDDDDGAARPTLLR